MSRPRLEFTPAQNDIICAMRAAGQTWPEIAEYIGMKETVTRRHAQRSLGIAGNIKGTAVNRSVAPLADMDRDPLPSGHSFTWGALTAGTSLAGEAYAP